MPVNRNELTLARLAHQHLTATPDHTPLAVVQWLGAVQAQDYRQALWAIGVRLAAATLMQVENAIEQGTILRTWSQRGTIHFVPAQDAKWMLKLCATKVLAAQGRRQAQLELTSDIIAHCGTLLTAALVGGRRLTRAEVFHQLQEHGIATTAQRGYHILCHLSQAGLLCIGPMQGSEQTFVLLDEWVPQSRTLTPDEALIELVWRFFASHGPATEADFARWSGLTLRETRVGLAENGSRLVSDVQDGVRYWQTDAASPVPSAENHLHLLPGFDEYFLGYGDRSALIEDQHAPKVVPGNNGIFKPVMVDGGQIVGTWHSRVRRQAVELTLSPFATIDQLEQRVQAATARYGTFLGLPIGKLAVDAPPTP